MATLEKFPEFMHLFKSLGTNFDVSEELLGNIEKYVCRLYGQISVDTVNEARFCLFSIGKYREDTMPCTRNVLIQHTLRAVYQASIWKSAILQIESPPSINDFGWTITDDGIVKVKWMTLPAAPDGILENVNCGCKSGCSSRRCACKKAELKCTSLCSCTNCENESDKVVEGEEDQESDGDDLPAYDDIFDDY